MMIKIAPFVSKAQRRYLYAKHPAIAKRWEKHTPEGTRLPEHVKKSALILKWVENALEKRAQAINLRTLLGE
jgi:hypothetical protein